MNYEEKSDHQINELVHRALGFNLSSGLWLEGRSVDYCNNPSDAWPIAEDNNIDIQNWDDYSRANACHTNDDIIFHDEPAKRGLRAAMIVFLMLKESDK